MNKSTGYTPNMMMLGREVNQPVDLLFPTKATEMSADQYVAELQKSLKKAHDVARRNLKTTQERMKRDYDLKTYVRVYDVGDPVYILDTATIKGHCKKLSPPWKGPGIVVNKFTPYLYRVKLKMLYLLLIMTGLNLAGIGGYQNGWTDLIQILGPS